MPSVDCEHCHCRFGRGGDLLLDDSEMRKVPSEAVRLMASFGWYKQQENGGIKEIVPVHI